MTFVLSGLRGLVHWSKHVNIGFMSSLSRMHPKSGFEENLFIFLSSWNSCLPFPLGKAGVLQNEASLLLNRLSRSSFTVFWLIFLILKHKSKIFSTSLYLCDWDWVKHSRQAHTISCGSIMHFLFCFVFVFSYLRLPMRWILLLVFKNLLFCMWCRKVETFEREIAVRAAAASIYSTCSFLMSKENVSCFWSR